MDLKGFSWIILNKDFLTQDKTYFGVKFNGNVYIYLIYGISELNFSSENAPNKLNDDDDVYNFMKHYLINKNIEKTRDEVFNELQNVLDNPECSVNPYDDSNTEEEIKPIETDDNISSNDNETETDDNPNSDYIPLLLEKYDNDILKMLDDNLTEYVGDKTNLAMLILSVVAVKCGLKSYIININGDVDGGKTTLIQTLFKLIPNKMIENHNNSTLSGIIRGSLHPTGLGYSMHTYDKLLIYLGNVTDERKKQMLKIEELIDASYKEQNYTSTMGSKSATEKTTNIDIKTNTFLSLTKSIKPYKSSNLEIRENTSYLTVTKPTRQQLIQQKRINYKENNPEFIEQHQKYIDNIKPIDIKEEYLSNKELINHIDENTNDLNYVEFERYEILYLSYCIYLNISPSIESFDRFQSMTPKDTTLTDEEEALIKFLKKHHTDKEITLSSKNRAKFKYFSTDNLKSYHSNIKVIKEADNLNKTLNNLVSKGALNKNADNLFYLNDV